ncbi:MAG: hypothetical protein ACM3W4_10455 [Ignavibacteriales bacterium]
MAFRRILALGAAIAMSGSVGVAAHPVADAAAPTTAGCPGGGYGMMGGYGMGPGMMGGAGYGMMGGNGPGAGGAWAGRPAGKLALTTKDVGDYLQGWLSRGGGTRLKVGRVQQSGDTITAEVVTKAHGDLVQRWAFDRNTGQMSPAG